VTPGQVWVSTSFTYPSPEWMGRGGPTTSCFLNIMASVFAGWIVSLFKGLELDVGEKSNCTENTIS